MYQNTCKQRSRRWAYLAVAVALSMAVMSGASAETGGQLADTNQPHLVKGVSVATVTTAHIRARDLLWDGVPKPEPPAPVVTDPQPIYKESSKTRGPETPLFAYQNNPAPASYKQDVKVRSEKPFVDIYNREHDWVNAEGSTKVDTWEGAKYAYRAQTGKGSELRFTTGKRAFEVNHKSNVAVNFPETRVVVGGGQPLAVDSRVEVYGAGANQTVNIASGDGPKYDTKWEVNAGPTNTIAKGRRLAGSLRGLLWDGVPKPEPPAPVVTDPQPIYKESSKTRGPETPLFAYQNNPAPASYKQDVKVRSEKPFVDIYNREHDWVNAEGSTKVDTWEGAKYAYRAQTGKGSELRFTTGKRAFEVNHKSNVAVNFPETRVVVGGGQPLAVDSRVEMYGAGANQTVNIASGDGPKYDTKWEVNAGPTNTIAKGRRLAGSLRGLLWDGVPKPEPPAPVVTDPQPIYKESSKTRGPETPLFAYQNNPAPASYKQDVKVRSEKPFVDIYNREHDWVNAEGSTKVDTWEGAKYAYRAQTGKGSELRFTTGKRAFEVNHKSNVAVNFPETRVVVGGGQPLAVDSRVEVYGAGANQTVNIASGDGPKYDTKWEVNAGPTNTIAKGRRLAGSLRGLLWDGVPKPEPPAPVVTDPQPIYKESSKTRGPETPLFAYQNNPAPASYKQDVKVRSEKPFVDIYNREHDWVNAEGSTKVDTWEGAKYAYRAQTGKGSELRFTTGKRAFEVNHKSNVAVNFPETRVVVGGGQPLAVDSRVEVYGAGANQTVNIASGDGPKYDTKWEVNAGPTNTIAKGRRLAGSLRGLLWDGVPKPEPPAPVVTDPQPIYKESSKTRGPETPLFAYQNNPAPASYKQDVKVRSEKPFVDIYNREHDWVNAEGSTKVDTWEGAKYAYRAQTGKGSELRFTTGKRAFEVNHKSNVAVNFPETRVVVGGGQPLAVDSRVEVYGAGANQTVNIASGDGPKYDTKWEVNAGPTNTIAKGRRLAGSLRGLLWDGVPKPEPPAPVVTDPQPIYKESSKTRGPETPLFAYQNNPAPASYKQDVKVRSEKPFVDIYNREHDWVNAEGSTKVDTWEGAKYAYRAQTGKGSELRFTTGKRAFEVNHKSNVAVNFPETRVVVGGGQPLAVDSRVEVYGAGANQTVNIASGDGPKYDTKWEVNAGPTNTIAKGRRLAGSLRGLLWDGVPKPEPPAPVVTDPQPIYKESSKTRGPETPLFAYQNNPAPASYKQDVKVRSEKPFVDIYNREHDWVNAEGSTKVDTWEGAKYAYRAQTGKGSELRFTTGKRAFEVNHKSNVAVNFPETRVVVGGGQPLAVDSRVEVYGAGANQTVNIASGDGPKYDTKWEVNAGPTNTIAKGRRLAGSLRGLLWDGVPKPEPPAPVVTDPQPIYKESSKTRGPETPLFAYQNNPAPASYKQDVKVRSEKPFVDIYNREHDWVNAEGSTKVDTWEGAKYAYRAQTGKGSELRFTTGKRAFEVNHKSNVAVNFPETRVVVGGGQPLAVDSRVEVYGAGANQTVNIASGDGPKYDTKWEVNAGPTNTIAKGR